MRKTTLLAVAALAATLAAGVMTAGAHRGPGDGLRLGQVGAAALVREAAQHLDVTEATLTDAIEEAAIERIDAAVAEGDLSSRRATKLKAKVRENVRLAMRISRTSDVAANLDVTTATLNDAFRAARKALLIARIDAAVAEGDLSAERAARLKARVERMRLPGYTPFSLRSGR